MEDIEQLQCRLSANTVLWPVPLIGSLVKPGDHRQRLALVQPARSGLNATPNRWFNPLSDVERLLAWPGYQQNIKHR
ncbi:hypothetical protein O9929_15010 [Vibrio lentus]|nr:hypothetical protein [Vibrio lentus]